MNRELIITREDKSKIKIEVSLRTFIFPHEFMYEISVMKKEFKKKWKVVGTEFNDNWEYRALSTEDRIKYNNKKFELVTKDEIFKAKMLLWESIKPSIDDI